MTEFVNRSIGARQHSYPETRGSGALPSAFARNFGFGPPGEGHIAIGTTPFSVQWQCDVGGTTVNVPITPKVTGNLRITGMLSVVNATGGALAVQVQPQIDGVPLSIPNNESATVPANSSVVVPIFAEVGPGLFGLRHVEIVLLGAVGLSLQAESSLLDIQEVTVASG